MNTATETKKANDLHYTATKIVSGESITVKIRLNDECKNGHQDFSITGDIYKANRPKTDSNWLGGGCIHEVIETVFPEFIPFIKLHLCDYKGIPMHAGANGFYHLRKGFNSKSTGEAFKAEFCEYYRVTPDQFDKLNESETEIQFSLKLQSLGILKQWEIEASAAIEYLETLTGTQFVIDSKKTQYIAHTDAQIEEENQKIASGYYTPEAKTGREHAKTVKLFTDLADEQREKISKINLEYDVKTSLLLAGGKRALDNAIFYDHTKTVAFNWRYSSYKLTPEEINAITSNLILPDGVKWEISKNK